MGDRAIGIGKNAIVRLQELLLFGIHVHKKTVKRILLENGTVPPKTRVTPPTWTAFLKAHKDLWALDFTCVFDIQGAQVLRGTDANQDIREIGRPMVAASISPSLLVVNES